MEAIQLDLFDFAAMQAAVQSKVQDVPETVVLRNFQNDGRHGMPTTPAARIEANFKAIRLLKELKAENGFRLMRSSSRFRSSADGAD